MKKASITGRVSSCFVFSTYFPPYYHVSSLLVKSGARSWELVSNRAGETGEELSIEFMSESRIRLLRSSSNSTGLEWVFSPFFVSTFSISHVIGI